MSKSNVTWALGVIGWVVSYALFVQWLGANRWEFFGGWHEAFTASTFATGLLSDLVLVSTMILVAAVWDRKRLGTRWTVAVFVCMALSASMALAVYLVGLWRSEREASAGDSPQGQGTAGHG